jgi:hypothetical protein
MIKKWWYKGAALLLTGTVLGLGLGDGCLAAAVQRILIANAFD